MLSYDCAKIDIVSCILHLNCIKLEIDVIVVKFEVVCINDTLLAIISCEDACGVCETTKEWK